MINCQTGGYEFQGAIFGGCDCKNSGYSSAGYCQNVGQQFIDETFKCSQNDLSKHHSCTLGFKCLTCKEGFYFNPPDADGHHDGTYLQHPYGNMLNLRPHTPPGSCGTRRHIISLSNLHTCTGLRMTLFETRSQNLSYESSAAACVLDFTKMLCGGESFESACANRVSVEQVCAVEYGTTALLHSPVYEGSNLLGFCVQECMTTLEAREW